jgi:hypothetical protein
MLFGKKKEAPANPYFNAVKGADKPPAQSPVPAQPEQRIENPPVQSPQRGVPFPIPLLPTPEPIVTPNIELEPMKMHVDIDAIRMSTGKPTAFIKLSDFKRVVDDIKNLEEQIAQSQNDLKEIYRHIDEQSAAVRNYEIMLSSLKRMMQDISISLANVEE